MLNPTLNIAQLQPAYAQQQALSIQNILAPQVAQDLHKALEELDWVLEINDYGPGPRLRIPMADLKNPDAPLLNALDEVANDLDRTKLFYMRLNVDGVDFQSQVLKDFAAFLNSEDFLTPMRQLTGIQDASHTWMEATCYKPCCFLGGHRDDHHASNRVAFVFNLTPHWQLDWGGLLTIVNANAQPTLVPPIWNSLSLFTVPRDHLVSTVSPAAQGNRYSITGWLRN